MINAILDADVAGWHKLCHNNTRSAVLCKLQTTLPRSHALRLAASWAQSHRFALRPPVATAGSHFPTQEMHAGKAGHVPAA